KTTLVPGIVMGLFSLSLLIVMPNQVRVPAYDSGAPSPRIIPGACLVLMLIFSIVLIIQSLVFKKEKIVEFDWEKEKPVIVMILMMCVYVALIIYMGYVIASIVTFIAVLFYCGERKLPTYVVTVVASVVIFFLFKNVFNIQLPALPFFMGG
ncbi:MAG: tripartite tricarboxylate transporter TctB family protein, partial [Gemmiger sp.]